VERIADRYDRVEWRHDDRTERLVTRPKRWRDTFIAKASTKASGDDERASR